MPFKIKEALDNSSGSLRNSKASVISVDASKGNLDKAKIPNISHYHCCKPESTGLRAWEFQHIGTGKLPWIRGPRETKERKVGEEEGTSGRTRQASVRPHQSNFKSRIWT